jgi:hypothetical protein
VREEEFAYALSPRSGVDEETSDEHRWQLLALRFDEPHCWARRTLVQRHVSDDSAIDNRHPGRHRLGLGEEASKVCPGKLTRVVVDLADAGRDSHQRIEVFGNAQPDLHQGSLTRAVPLSAGRETSRRVPLSGTYVAVRGERWRCRMVPLVVRHRVRVPVEAIGPFGPGHFFGRLLAFTTKA